MRGPSSQKLSGFSYDLMALWKIKQLHANPVEMRFGVTGALVACDMAFYAILVFKDSTNISMMDNKGPVYCITHK